MSTGPAGKSNGRAPQRPESPRRVKHGVRLESREGPRADNWVAQKWLSVLEHAVDAAEREEAFAYARAGQVISMEIHPGLIEASVQGRAPKPYATQIRLPTLNEAQWHELIIAMSSEAMYAAKLLSGEMPQALEDLFGRMGRELLPARLGVINVKCTCAESVGGACKHAAAVALLLADRLSREPTLLFTFYGMSADRILDRLRQARAVQLSHGAAGHGGFHPGESAIPEAGVQPAPLETCLDDFWRCGPQLAELEQAPPPQHVAHALLRRLGPSAMKGKFPMVGLLASIYDEVASAAVQIRDQAERLSGSDPTQDSGA